MWARSRRPTSNCLPGSVRATIRRLTVSRLDALHAHHLRLVEQKVGQAVVAHCRRRHLAQHIVDPVDVGRGRDGNVHHGAGPILRQVQRFDDLAVGEVYTSPSQVRSRVTRRVTSSTVPRAASRRHGQRDEVAEAVLLSVMRKNPLRRSWTIRWAPKPSAAPDGRGRDERADGSPRLADEVEETTT